MLFLAPEPGTVKVGSVVVGFQEDNFFYIYDDMPEKIKLEQKEKYRALTHQVQDELFSTSEKLIPSGIKILSWASGNAVVFAEDEDQLIQRMQNFAREHQIYFFPSLLVLGDYKGPDENHVLAIQPDGIIAYDHYKGEVQTKDITRAILSKSSIRLMEELPHLFVMKWSFTVSSGRQGKREWISSLFRAMNPQEALPICILSCQCCVPLKTDARC